MNIAFLHYSYPGIGGTETVTRLLADYFASIGHQIYVIAWHKGENGIVPRSVKDVLVLSDSKDFNAAVNTGEIAEYVKRNNIDVLINQGPFWKVEPSVKTCGCKVISVLHYSPTYRVDNNRNAIKRLWGNQTGNPIYFAKTAIRRLFIEHFAQSDFKKNERNQLRSIVKDSDAFVVLCDKYIDQLKGILDIEADNIYAINNPIENINDIPTALTKEERKNVVFVGRLTRWDKRVDRLLRIWAKVYPIHPEWSLYIVGDGEEKANLERMANKLKLQNIIFTGFTDPKPYYRKSSIQCLTSSSEGFPMVILEAQQYGLVPIAYNASHGIEAVISDSGVLVQPFSLNVYADQLSTLMTDGATEQYREKINDNIKKYEIAKIGKCWESLFNKISVTKE